MLLFNTIPQSLPGIGHVFSYYGTAATSLFTILVLSSFFLFVRDPLSSIPGPFLARVSRLWLIQHSLAGDMHRVTIALHERYGKLVRTGPNEVSTSDLSAIKTIYGAGTKFRKSDWYSVWQGRRAFDLFAERDERVHGAQRRLVSSIYSLKALSALEGCVDDTVRLLMRKLADMTVATNNGRGQSTPVDMGLWAQLFAFDVVGAVTFSARAGFLDRGADDGSFGEIDGALRSAAWIGQVPWLYWLHDAAAPYVGNWLGITARHGALREFAFAQVAGRKARSDGDDGGRSDILTQLNEVHRKKPDEFDEMGVLSMATSNIFAGSDTTAISIGSILYHLCKFPETKAKLIDEIEQVRKKGLLNGAENNLDAALPIDVAMNRMPYLQACIYEALRLHPAVGMTLPRVTPEGGIEIDGRFIPAGTVVGANPWVIHRNREVFGDDVEVFRPERWIESGERARGDMERHFFAFGAGARGCIGRNLSWIEMSKMVPLLLLNFDVRLAESADWREHCYWFVKQEGLMMSLVLRK